MEKTSEQIEEDVYRAIKNSSLKDAVKGRIYRDGMRPKDASDEDVVVKFLAGADGQEQRGVVLIHIYVPKISVCTDGETVKDIRRISDLMSVANEVVASITNSEYLFEKDATPKAFPAEGIEQHFINIRLTYRRITF